FLFALNLGGGCARAPYFFLDKKGKQKIKRRIPGKLILRLTRYWRQTRKYSRRALSASSNTPPV
ncbi:MAG: hypothetical protein WCP79_15365, partial [Bacillota bacterium]